MGNDLRQVSQSHGSMVEKQALANRQIAEMKEKSVLKQTQMEVHLSHMHHEHEAQLACGEGLHREAERNRERLELLERENEHLKLFISEQSQLPVIPHHRKSLIDTRDLRSDFY